MLNWSILLSMFLLILIAHSRWHPLFQNTPPTRSFVPPLVVLLLFLKKEPSSIPINSSSFHGLIVEEPARLPRTALTYREKWS